mmetsp:Transcript_2481/g.5161  ORF Transcript_2481/g.5161 Transcript_2481/m.5161 type:complete len:406 (+) Transcript_2481:88-1305(+)
MAAAVSPSFTGTEEARREDIHHLFRTISFKNLRKGDEELQLVPKRARKFYETQNDFLEELDELSFAFGSSLETRRSSGEKGNSSGQVFEKEELKKAKRMGAFVVRLSFVANVCLLGTKAFATVITGSLVVLSSFLDSFLDLVSGLILFITSSVARRRSPLYPVGLKRMEPLGVVIFSAVMGMSAVWIIIEAARRVISVLSDGSNNTAESGEGETEVVGGVFMDPLTLGLLGGVIVVKLVLWIVCRQVQSVSAQAYADDHRNDVLTNAFSLVSSLIIFFLPDFWWMDPLSATILALYILINWTKTARENIVTLIGKAAPPEVHRQLTTLILASNADVSAINTVRAFHAGENYTLEVHVVLPPDMPLKEAHDIGQNLQIQLEALPPIDRAYVHLDCEVGDRVDHKPL